MRPASPADAQLQQRLPAPDPSTRIDPLGSESIVRLTSLLKQRPAIEGTFVLEGWRLVYRVSEVEEVVQYGSNFRVLCEHQGRILFSDGVHTWWFDPNAEEMKLTWVDNLPPSIIEAVSGDGFLLVRTWTGAYLLRDGEEPIALSAPRYVRFIDGMSISQNGQRLVVVYDRDVPYIKIPGSRRVGDIRVYDIQTTAEVMRWPLWAEQANLNYGLGLYGWVDDETLRFVFGYHGEFTTRTWHFAEDAPREQTEKANMIDRPAVSRDGAWVAYRSTAYELVVEEVGKPSNRVVVAQSGPRSAAGDPRFLLNGHLAVRGWEQGIWWELLSDGTWQRWENVEELF